MLYILSQVWCELYIGCDLPKDQEFVITLLHKDHCTSCDDIMPILEEIDSRLERNNKKVTFRYKNCSVCDCKEIKDEELPTVRINQNEVELSKISDLSGFRSITDKIIEITGYDKNIFTRRIKTNPGHVVKLNERDFYSGFDGPWIILFYNKTSDAKRELIYRLAPQYKSKIHVGEINGNNSEVLLNRFAISYLPTMIALYDGLIVGYNGRDNMDELRDFADELVKPSFTNLTLEEFNNLKRITPHSDPIFIVFYNEVGLANETFKNIAHDYKFRVNIYKSNDPELMKLANVTVSENHLELCVYKNMIFHFASQNIMRSEKLYEWIWHAHYPSVAQLSNDNFYAIMHGLKPSIILLSKNEELVPEFQLASEFIHKGEPFADQIFASINVETYSLFIPKLLPKISIPSLVILNPSEQKFYTKKVKLTKDNMKDTVEKMIELYNMGQLESYPFKTSYYRYIFLLIGVMGLVYILNSKIKQKKYKIVENIGQN